MQPGCISKKQTLRNRRLIKVAAVGALALLMAACGSSSPSGTSTTTSTPVAQQSGTVWLCRPGQADDPCTASLKTTVVPANGARTVEAAQSNSSSPFDCFYVYPTVSTQHSDNSNLTVQPAEIGAAVAQASRFSQVCRVWAPMYHQRTESSLLKGLGNDPRADAVAYASVLSAWKDYLAHDNDGRPVIFIGHSQGSAMLIRLLASQIDPDPALRSRTIMAIIPGGNVTVPVGQTVGATFQHLPLCTASGQTGCIIAYSSFPTEPPANSDFGRPGQGVSLQSDQRATTGLQVACVNPAALGGGAATLDPYFLTATSTPPPPPVTTPWVSYPDLYTASCQSSSGATWLQVSTLTVSGRPVVTETLGPVWGFHLDDINLALGNLVDDVASAEATWTSHH
jgi:hypothetical protein